MSPYRFGKGFVFIYIFSFFTPLFIYKIGASSSLLQGKSAFAQ